MKRLGLFIIRTIIISALTTSLVGCGQMTDSGESSPTAPTSINVNSSTASYFKSVAFGSEFGSNSTAVIRRWNSDIRLKLHGNVTASDLDFINAAVEHLNSLTGEHITISLTDSDNANLSLYIVDKAEFSNIIPTVQPNVDGYVQVTSRSNVIFTGKILISNNLAGSRRNHVISEELTQSLGLLCDSLIYSDSIFYQNYSSVTQYSSEDEDIISLLYSDAIRPGLTERQFNEMALIL
ncbi:MAG: DUF2927 domain-containing protein [bacterium]|nr:DUF2927 domain-containing protein [bacterium]